MILALKHFFKVILGFYDEHFFHAQNNSKQFELFLKIIALFIFEGCAQQGAGLNNPAQGMLV